MSILCGIYDKVSARYIDYITHTNAPSAQRWFDDLMTDSKPNMLNKHPNDFEFHQLAIIEDILGHVEYRDKLIMAGSEYVSNSESEGSAEPEVNTSN